MPDTIRWIVMGINLALWLIFAAVNVEALFEELKSDRPRRVRTMIIFVVVCTVMMAMNIMVAVLR